MPSLTKLANLGGADRYILTRDDGEEARFIVPSALKAVMGEEGAIRWSLKAVERRLGVKLVLPH